MSIIQTTQQISKKVRKVSKEQKPKKRLIIVNWDSSDDDDDIPIAKLITKRRKVEFYFPEDVWRYIKELAMYGVIRTCQRNIGPIPRPVLCGVANTRLYPTFVYIDWFNWKPEVEDRPKLGVYKEWLCDGCIRHKEKVTTLDSFQHFRKEQVANRAEEINSAKPDKSAGYVKKARTSAMRNLYKRLEKRSVDENMKELEEIYWKPYITSWKKEIEKV